MNDGGGMSGGGGTHVGYGRGGDDLLAVRFESARGRLRAVAYRMLGSLAEAEDAVQETWLKLGRTDSGAIENLDGWLTTVVGRECLDMLRSRRVRREQPIDETFVPDPVLRPLAAQDPEHEAFQADSVGLAMLVVLETLEPAERLAFVLHDMFAVPFDDIAPVVERTSAATRQLASRARRRVRTAAPAVDPDRGRQREVIEAFFAASRGGDFEALVALLHPDAVQRVDAGALLRGAGGSKVVRGARSVAAQAYSYRRLAGNARLVLVNGAVGAVTVVDGRPVAVMSLAIKDGLITHMYILSDQQRLAGVELPDLGE